MFGHDDNAQTTQDAAPQSAPIDGAGAASNMDVTTVGPDSGATAPGFDSGGLGMPEPVGGPDPAAAPSPAEPVSAPAAPATSVDDTDDDLLQIKQQALQQLSPLVGHLDQTPEEKFRTTMMMIQASDNQALIRDAYTAANAIEDEKTRAQALLDIINEINYFTQQQQS